jgi:hypothetical protein
VRKNDEPKKGMEEEKFPMSGEQALALYGDQFLTAYELVEISCFKEVYYINRRERVDEDFYKESTKNQGFDDEESYFRYKIGGHIMFRLEIIKKVGKGSFGQVL